MRNLFIEELWNNVKREQDTLIFRCKFGRKCQQHLTYYEDYRLNEDDNDKRIRKKYDLAKEKIISFHTIESDVVHFRAK